jgi:NADPH:quinone reductase-like Zn-dependent oxidoreductase
MNKLETKPTMKAVTIEKFGNAEVLKSTTVPRPSAAKGEVLIRISHTSVNPVDWKIREGYLKDMLPHVFPIIPGWDAAGTVEAVGEAVTGFKPGDRVAAYARLPEVHQGTYAEYINLPTSFLAKLPDSVSFDQAAGVPLVALTAFQGLNDDKSISPGAQVLVLNAAGGVGSYAVQFAKQLGAIVTATTSAANRDYVKSLGADHVIDYTSESLTDSGRKIAPQGFDFVFDAVGGESLAKAYALVKSNGSLVSIVDSPDSAKTAEKKIHARFHFVYPDGKQLQSIFDSIANRKTKLPAYSIRPISEAKQAQQSSETHRTRGKIVLAINF